MNRGFGRGECSNLGRLDYGGWVIGSWENGIMGRSKYWIIVAKDHWGWRIIEGVDMTTDTRQFPVSIIAKYNEEFTHFFIIYIPTSPSYKFGILSSSSRRIPDSGYEHHWIYREDSGWAPYHHREQYSNLLFQILHRIKEVSAFL